MKTLISKFFTCITAAILSVNLMGCVAAVAAGAAVAGGSLVYYHKRVGGYVSDKQIAATADNRIYGDKELFAENHIVVGVAKGTVLLVGQASKQEYKQRAENIVKNINGVERVYNEIVIGPSISLWQQTKDTTITSKIKSAMLTRKNFDPSLVKVITENNVVYLMGVVTPKQADEAVDIARNTQGVTKVVKVMQYITN